MSKTVDRLNELERRTAAMPWPLDFFFMVPDDAFELLFALNQAWPFLRSEIAHLEDTILPLMKRNDELEAEHPRLAKVAHDAAKALGDERDRRARDTASLQAMLTTAMLELASLRAQVKALPRRLAAAEAVCRSIDTTRHGSGGAFGHYDGAAHDAWKATRTAVT